MSHATAPMPWVVDALRRASIIHSQGRLAHGLLVSGPAGLGKRVFAAALSQLLLCREPSEAGACGNCRDCQLMAAGSHPDLRQVEFEERKTGGLRTELTVAQIRRLTDSMNLTPQRGGAVVVVMDPADAMNTNAANALLKTLEEPQPGRYLLLIADRPERLPTTLRSRCQRLAPQSPPTDVGVQWLIEQGHDEAIASEALGLADNLPLRALGFIEDDVIGLNRAVRRDLGDVATGKQAPFIVSRDWLGDRPALRLQLAVGLVRELGWKRLAPAGALTGLTGRVDVPKLASWADRVNRARGLLDSPIRHDLMIGELLLDWQKAFAA